MMSWSGQHIQVVMTRPEGRNMTGVQSKRGYGCNGNGLEKWIVCGEEGRKPRMNADTVTNNNNSS